MNLTWHIVRKDLGRLRLPLALWIALIAAKLGLGAVLLWGGIGGIERFGHIAAAGNWLIAGEVLTGYALVAALMHDDVLTGTTAFWTTRPISGGRMLTAKLIELAIIFGIVPLAVTLPWWLVCGYGGRELLLAAGETLFWQMLVVVSALPLAALTDGFSRYLMWTFVVIMATVVAALIISTTPGPSGRVQLDGGLLATRGWLAGLLFVIGGAVATVQQFRTRRILRSFTIVGTGVAAAVLVLAAWPWNLSRNSVGWTDHPGSHAAEISVAFREARSTDVPKHDTELDVGLKLDGVPAGFWLQGEYATHRWNWPSGLTLERSGWLGFHDYVDRGAEWVALGLPSEKANLEYQAYVAALWARRGLPQPPTPEPNLAGVLLKVPASFAARMRQERPAYLFRGHFQLYQSKLVDERPPLVGERLDTGAERTRIVDVGQFTRVNRVSRFGGGTEHSMGIALVEHAPALWWDGHAFNSVGTWLNYQRSDTEYFLVNRTRGNASAAEWSWPAVARFGTVAIAWRGLNFSAPSDWRDGKWIEQPGWFEGVTLAKVVNREEERFTKELRVERFEVRPAAKTGGAP